MAVKNYIYKEFWMTRENAYDAQSEKKTGYKVIHIAQSEFCKWVCAQTKSTKTWIMCKITCDFYLTLYNTSLGFFPIFP